MTFDIRQVIMEQNDARLMEAEGDKAHTALNTIGDLMSQIEKQIGVLERDSRQYKGWQTMARQLRKSVGNMEKSITKGVESS